MPLFAASALAAAAACKGETPTATETKKEVAAAAENSGTSSCAGSKRHGGKLHWFEDDYPAALACAKAKRLPLIIDMWAPWCHTCLSMKSTVLTEERLGEEDARFVFVALDTDRDVNAQAVAKFTPAFWPTFFAVSPIDETVLTRFVGAATLAQFVAFLGDGAAAFAAAQAGKGDEPGFAVAARDGDRAATAKDFAAAQVAFARALDTAPANWARRSDVLAALISVQRRQGDFAACAATALSRAGGLRPAASQSDFFGDALSCADELEKTPTGKESATKLRQLAAERLGVLAADAAAPLSADDRSDALMYLRTALDALGRKPEADAAAQTQRQLLDTAAAAASTPLAAMTFNWPRAEVYTYLGKGLELVPALEKSCADLPKEYDPPYRLAWVLLKAGHADKAVPWIEKAQALAYGPRRNRVFGLAADVFEGAGLRDRAHKAVLAQIEVLRQSPATASSEKAIADAVARAATLAADKPMSR